MSPTKMRILVVDDEPAMLEVLQQRLENWGFEVQVASNGRIGESLAESFNPDLVISDVVMPEVSGLELLDALRAGNPARPVILMTAQGSIDLAVDAMKQGARDFITKPLDYAKLKSLLEAAEREVHSLRESHRRAGLIEKGAAGFAGFVGISKAIREIYGQIESVSGSDASVLIAGESGTGKELVARTIHQMSRRSGGPFIAINSAAIPENLVESEVFGHEKGAFTGAIDRRPGCFELAHRGTLFLDEIAEMPVALQPKLLRVLEDGRVRRIGGKQEFAFDVRVVAATNQEPQKAIEAGKFRQDLYYRLNVFTVSLPPLRERRTDIALLAQHFVSEFNRRHSMRIEAIREDALEMLRSYAWPGNVRELRNVMERAVILAKRDWIEAAHLPPYVREPLAAAERIVLPLGVTAAEAEKELILRTLERADHNKAEAARLLGLDVKTIRNKLKSYGID